MGGLRRLDQPRTWEDVIGEALLPGAALLFVIVGLSWFLASRKTHPRVYRMTETSSVPWTFLASCIALWIAIAHVPQREVRLSKRLSRQLLSLPETAPDAVDLGRVDRSQLSPRIEIPPRGVRLWQYLAVTARILDKRPDRSAPARSLVPGSLLPGSGGRAGARGRAVLGGCPRAGGRSGRERGRSPLGPQPARAHRPDGHQLRAPRLPRSAALPGAGPERPRGTGVHGTSVRPLALPWIASPTNFRACSRRRTARGPRETSFRSR